MATKATQSLKTKKTLSETNFEKIQRKRKEAIEEGKRRRRDALKREQFYPSSKR